jgi:putative phosphoribosyl transferase
MILEEAGDRRGTRKKISVRFRDRRDAGLQLGEAVAHLANSEPVVLGLPRGGVAVALEIARKLHAPLDVIVVRKLGAPIQPQLAVGAIGEGDIGVRNEQIIESLGMTPDEVAAIERAAREEVQRRSQRLRSGRPKVSLTGRVAIVADDGIATGATAKAACQFARSSGAARIVLAVPVAARWVLPELSAVADEVVCLEKPLRLVAVGEWYRDFSEVSEDEVVAMLAEAA